MPFTAEQFFQVFEKYNEAIFPMQIILVLTAFVTVVLVNNPNLFTNKIIAVLLGLFWLWTGIFYHLFFFTEINGAAYFFSAVFVLEGFLFLYSGLMKKNLSFSFEPNIYGVFGLILIVYSLAIYPLIGYLNGRIFPASPTFGAPCPTVIFTFGLLMWMDKKIASHLLVIPFLWAIIGTSAALNFGVTEDFGLLTAAIIAAVFILRRKFAPEKEELL